jgi:nitrogen fixation protein NifU and related proteins
MVENKFENYNKEVMKRFMNPKNMGEMENPDAVGEVGNMKCGDIMKVYLRIKDNIIEDVKFQTFGCVAAIASSDALCDAAKGKTIEEAKNIENKDIVERLGNLPAIKLHCSVLGAGALKAAIADYEGVEYKEEKHEDMKCE